jgi:DNA polymerase III delta prime subunit
MAKTKIKKLEEEVKDATNKADKDVERANQSYHEFMSYYSDYQSDLKRRGHEEVSTMRKDAGELRRSSEGPKESDRKSESSDKKTKRVDK